MFEATPCLGVCKCCSAFRPLLPDLPKRFCGSLRPPVYIRASASWLLIAWITSSGSATSCQRRHLSSSMHLYPDLTGADPSSWRQRRELPGQRVSEVVCIGEAHKLIS
eukprot:symbB.v1.2.003239.t2/scaffold179.1/size284905/6